MDSGSPNLLSTRRVPSRIIFCNASSYNSSRAESQPRPDEIADHCPSSSGNGHQSTHWNNMNHWWSPAHLKLPKPLSTGRWASVVISSGGRLVTQLQDEGTEHIEWALGRKSAFTLFEIPKFRRFIDQQKPDIVHAQIKTPRLGELNDPNASPKKVSFKLGSTTPPPSMEPTPSVDTAKL